MREHISVDVLANWVVMLRADVDGAILLSDDDNEARFYERCIHERSRVVPAQDIALPLLDRVELRGIRGVVATLRGTGPYRNSPNVFRPFFGDVASLLLFSKSSDGVIGDVCGHPWLVACEKEVGPIRKRVAAIARLLQEARRVCLEECLAEPCFSDPSEIVEWSSFQLDWDRLDPILLSSGLAKEQLDQLRAVQLGGDFRSSLVGCDGMDAVRIFAAATSMYRPHGISSLREIDAASLLSMFRVAFDLREFEEDGVFWQMRRWERVNPRYPLLRRWRSLDPLGVVWDQRYWESDLAVFLTALLQGESLAIFKMDLDNFRHVNESMGHGVGDEAIRLYCSIVQRVLGGVGEVYRRGGDEVVVLAPSLAEQRARELAERTRVEIEADFKRWSVDHGLGSHPPTASIGLVLAACKKSAQEAIQLADQAQQQAKQQGKNRVFFLR
jgi:diguanylate cyclase (GGDEF)-like protein